jgi:hypothetical protein
MGHCAGPPGIHLRSKRRALVSPSGLTACSWDSLYIVKRGLFIFEPYLRAKSKFYALASLKILQAQNKINWRKTSQWLSFTLPSDRGKLKT